MTNLHLVFGGRVKDPRTLDFQDLGQLEVVGFYPTRQAAESAWRGAAQLTVDDAEMRYVVVELSQVMPATGA